MLWKSMWLKYILIIYSINNTFIIYEGLVKEKQMFSFSFMWLLKSSGLMQMLIQISQTAQSRTEIFFWTIILFIDAKTKTKTECECFLRHNTD